MQDATSPEARTQETPTASHLQPAPPGAGPVVVCACDRVRDAGGDHRKAAFLLRMTLH